VQSVSPAKETPKFLFFRWSIAAKIDGTLMAVRGFDSPQSPRIKKKSSCVCVKRGVFLFFPNFIPFLAKMKSCFFSFLAVGCFINNKQISFERQKSYWPGANSYLSGMFIEMQLQNCNT